MLAKLHGRDQLKFSIWWAIQKRNALYAWSYRDGDQIKSVAVLEIPPVDSPGSAVKVAIAIKGRREPSASKTFQPLRCGLTSITVIVRDSFEFEECCQLFVGSNDESLSVVALRVCCEKHATSQINVR
jgi:hypothetical protein